MSWMYFYLGQMIKRKKTFDYNRFVTIRDNCSFQFYIIINLQMKKNCNVYGLVDD